MASNGVKDTTTAENGSGLTKKILDLNTAEPDDILDGGEVKGLLSDSADVSGEKKEESDSKAIGAGSGDVSSPVDDVQKKIRRAERFGVSVKLTEEEKRNSRAERFGTVAAAVKGSEGTKKAEELKRKARADRFGVPASSSSTTKADNTEEEAKKKARLARFGKDTKADSAEEDKRKARALRFSKPASDSSSELPGKLNRFNSSENMAAAACGQLNLEEPTPIRGSRSVDCFEKLEQIGEGTYGQVYMAKDIKTGEIVALKKIRMDNEREGFPITAIREIKILKKLHHENVIHLKEIVTSPGRDRDDQGKPDNNKYKGGIYMVFEYMDHDLTGLADRPGLRFTVPQIKCYMKQLLTGLHYCHVNQVLHRDIKGSNLLIDNEGNLKLADFGLARSYSHDHSGNLTNRVITLWYRPPELLLGATKYGPAIDMWSVGCIFAELLNGKPILPGKTESEQLNKIYELCGSPDENNWPGVTKMPWYNQMKSSRPLKRRVREVYRHFDRHALELLEKMLVLDPSQRISAKDALDAEYFWTDPLPCDPKSLPTYESSHEFQTKKKRQQMRHNEEAAKKQKLQHPQQQQHSRLPPQQHGVGQSHAAPHWPGGPNHPINNGPPPQLPAGGPSGHNYYQKARVGGAPGPNRYPPGGNQTGGYNNSQSRGGYSSGSYPPQGRGGAPYGGAGPRGPSGGYGAGPPNYSQGGGGQYGGSGRGQNPMGGARNQQYGWQP